MVDCAEDSRETFTAAVMKRRINWKSIFTVPRIRYYATWWTCMDCGFKYLRRKHEEKDCPLCRGTGKFSHLVMLNPKRIG